MITLKRVFEVLLGIIVICISGVLLFRLPALVNQQNSQSANTPKIPIVEQSVASTIQDSEVKAPDGTLKLVMHVEIKNKQKTYTFTVSDNNGNNAHQVFTKTITSGDMALPANSWSPNNTYVFILDTEKNTTGVFIFKASGESFANNQQYLDVTGLFAQHITNYSFQEATGWVAPDLLIVETTDNNSGAQGPSYWFEVSSQGFIPLASHQ